jgi:hypothetical protein
MNLIVVAIIPVKNGLVCIKDMAQHTESDTKHPLMRRTKLKHKGRR